MRAQNIISDAAARSLSRPITRRRRTTSTTAAKLLPISANMVSPAAAASSPNFATPVTAPSWAWKVGAELLRLPAGHLEEFRREPQCEPHLQGPHRIPLPEDFPGAFDALNTSKWTANAALFYDTPKFSARVAYNYRSPYRLFVWTETPSYSWYNDTTSRLDAAVNFTPVKFLTLRWKERTCSAPSLSLFRQGKPAAARRTSPVAHRAGERPLPFLEGSPLLTPLAGRGICRGPFFL